MLDRQRLARERGFVEHDSVGQDSPVHGQHLAGAHTQHIARQHLVDGDIGLRAAIDPVRDARCSGQQSAQFPLRPGPGARFDHPTGRQHQRDDRSGQVLTDGDGAQKGHHRQHVDAEPPVSKRRHHPVRAEEDAGGDGGDPERIADRPSTHELRRGASEEQDHRRDEHGRGGTILMARRSRDRLHG